MCNCHNETKPTLLKYIHKLYHILSNLSHPFYFILFSQNESDQGKHNDNTIDK